MHDNDLEFINREIKELLEEKGIRNWSYILRNKMGVLNAIRTTMEAARKILHSKKMPKTFWTEAVKIAVFVLNRTGSSPISGVFPFKLWYKKNVNMDVFKISGSRVAGHVPKEKELKLDAKNKEGIFVGYSDTVKRYRIYFPYNKKVEILKDVIFLPEKSETPQENSIFIEPEDDQEEAYEEGQVEIQIHKKTRNATGKKQLEAMNHQ